MHCIHASASKQNLSNYDFHSLSTLKCNSLGLFQIVSEISSPPKHFVYFAMSASACCARVKRAGPEGSC